MNAIEGTRENKCKIAKAILNAYKILGYKLEKCTESREAYTTIWHPFQSGFLCGERKYQDEPMQFLTYDDNMMPKIIESIPKPEGKILYDLEIAFESAFSYEDSDKLGVAYRVKNAN